MDSDVDISRWVIELLLRDRHKNTIAKRVLAVAPLPDHRDWRLKKSVLLRTIESAIYDDVSVTESILEALENIEALDRRQGFGTTAAMRAAYCAVATDCFGGKKYLEALDRIWRGRVRVLESERSELVSVELRERRSEVEAGIWDRSVSRKLERMNTKNDALRLVEAYVKEAWDSIGPPFVTLAVRFDMAKEIDGNVGDECGKEEVRVLNGDNLRDGSKLEGNVVDGSKPEVEMEVASTNGGDLDVGIELTGNSVNGASDGSGVKAGMVNGVNIGGNRSKWEAWRVKNATNVGGVTVAFPKFGYLLGYHTMDGIVQVVGPGRSAPNVKSGVLNSEAATEEKEIPWAVKSRHKHGLVKNRDAEYVGMGSMMNRVPAEVRKLQELESDVAALQAVLTDPLLYDSHVPEMVTEMEVNFVGRANPSVVKNTEHDHSYTGSHGTLTSSDQNNIPRANPSVVKNTEHDHSYTGSHGTLTSSDQNNIPKATGKEYDGSNSSVDKGKSTVHVRSGDLYPGVLCCINQTTGPRPGLMERNSTAHTYEWDDSLGMSPDGTVKGRIHDLHSPKRKAISPLKNEDKRFAKRRKVKIEMERT